MLLKRNRAEEARIIRWLLTHPRHFCVNSTTIELGSNWIDLLTAAALLSRTAFWGNRPDLRAKGPVNPVAGAELVLVRRQFNLSARTILVVFEIGGAPPEELRTRRLEYHYGERYVNPDDRKRNLDRLVEICLDAQEKAIAKYGEAVKGGLVV